MTPLFRRALIALIAAMLVLPASPALAAEPVAWENVDVALHNESSGSILIVSGVLPDSVELPAQAELAVPAGSQLLWAGEILGGPVSEDPEVTYTVTSRDGMDVYAFTLTQSRIAQLEADAASAVAFDGTNYSAKIDWTAPWPVPSLSVAARIPQGAQVTSPDEGANMGAGPQGFSYYRKDLTDVSAGQKASLAFAYTPPVGAATGAGTTGSQTGGGGVATAIAIVVILGALVLIAFAVWRKMESRREIAGPAAGPSSDSPVLKQRSSKGATSAGPSASAKPGNPRTLKKSTILAVVVGVALIVGVIIAASSGGSANVVGDTVIMNYATVDECAVANIQLTPPPGANLADDAEKILETLRPLEGIGKAAINLTTGSMTVDYCQSYADDTRIRQLVAPTGYIQEAAATPLPPAVEATPSP